MKKSSLKPFHPLLILVFCLFAEIAWSEEPMRGPLPSEQREIIKYMAKHHEELIREVKLSKDGYEASTTTENEELARKLKQHFAYMEKRIGSGAMVRRWDPAFVELVKFQDQITTEVQYLDNGIRVTVTGNTPNGVKVAQNHARIVTGFTEKGAAAVREKHQAVIDQTGP
jgi:hypothetical protein